MNPKLVFSGVVAVLVVALFVSLNHSGQPGPAGKDGVSVGAVSVLNSPLEINGELVYFQRIPIRSASTTVCTFRTPSATSTGEFSVSFTSHPAYNAGYQVALANFITGTTTDLLDFSGPGLWVVSSTSRYIYPPNLFLTVKLATSSGTTVGSEYNPTGTCSVAFKVL